MNIEGANGKNLVHHVGKLYNIARQIAQLQEQLGGHVEADLVSATVQSLRLPRSALVRMSTEEVLFDAVAGTVHTTLNAMPRPCRGQFLIVSCVATGR